MTAVDRLARAIAGLDDRLINLETRPQLATSTVRVGDRDVTVPEALGASQDAADAAASAQDAADAAAQVAADAAAELAQSAARYAETAAAVEAARGEITALDDSLGELDGVLAAAAKQLPLTGQFMPTDPHPEGTVWFQTNASGHFSGIWVQAGPGDGTNWQGRPLASSAVVSLTAAQITAGTGTFQTAVAQKIWAEVITAARVSANRAVFRDLVAEHVNVVSSNGGRGVRITDQGFILLDEDGSVAVDLTTAASTYLSILSGGRRVAGISSDGAVSAIRGAFSRDVVVAGQSVVAGLANAGGRSLGKAQLANTLTVPAGTMMGVREKAFTVPRSGHRQIVARGAVELGEGTRGWAVAGFHVSTNAYTTTGNTRRRARSVEIYPDHRGAGEIEWEINTGELDGVQPGQTVRVLMSLQAGTAAATVIEGTGTYLTLWDMGPAVPTSRTIVETGAPATRAPERTVTRDTVRVPAVNFQSYRADGSQISKTGSDVGAKYAVQGNSGVGMKWSVIQFDYARLAEAVQGATIISVKVHINAAHWYGDAGTAVVGVYGPIPASLPSSQAGAWGLKAVRMGRGDWGSVTFDSNVHAGFQSLQTQSILLFTTNGTTEFYGYMNALETYLEIEREK